MNNQKFLPYENNFINSVSQIRSLFVVVAMESEEKALLHGTSWEDLELGSRYKVRLRRIRLSKCDIYVARSGVGLVKAGILLEKACEALPIEAILQLGVGGALDPRLNPGDTVVASQIIQHDSVSRAEGGTILIAPGELTLSASDDEQVDPIMRCDQVLTSWVKDTISLTASGRTFVGTTLSGSEFVASQKEKQKLRRLHPDALLVDMEAAALAQLSRFFQISFASAKTVADRADPELSVSADYKAFLASAAAHSGAILGALLKTFS